MPTRAETATPAFRSAAGWLVLAAVLNLPFGLGHPSWPLVASPLIRSLIIGAVLMVAPGIAWMEALVTLRLMTRRRVQIAFGLSAFALVAGLVALHVAGRPGSAPLLWNCTWALTNVGLLTAVLAGGRAPAFTAGPQTAVAVAAFLAAYLFFFWGATSVVAPQGDHDLDLQGTAYGLVHDLKPAYETARGTYYLAHPPLLHFLVAGSFVYYGQLNALEVYDPFSPQAKSPDEQWPYYEVHPFLIETRTPNIFIGAMTIALVAVWASGSLGVRLGWLIALAYATLPEAFVRFSYGGYFAISNFFAVLVAMSVARREADALAWRSGGLLGVLTAWANHKLAVVPVALVLWRLLARGGATLFQSVRRASSYPVVVGFVLGSVMFWVYGFWVSPTDFWNDHIRHHIVDRLIGGRPTASAAYYPGVMDLWLEFWRDTSYLLVPIAVGTLAWAFRTERTAERSAETVVGFVMTWVLVAAVGLSLVDWRQSKHLAELLLPGLVAAMIVGCPSNRSGRRLVSVALVLLILINAWGLANLAHDFGWIVKTPEW